MALFPFFYANILHSSGTMSVLVVLIGFSLIVALIFLGAFLWSIKAGQYEDAHTPGIRILFDDEHIDPRNARDADA